MNCVGGAWGRLCASSRPIWWRNGDEGLCSSVRFGNCGPDSGPTKRARATLESSTRRSPRVERGWADVTYIDWLVESVSDDPTIDEYKVAHARAARSRRAVTPTPGRSTRRTRSPKSESWGGSDRGTPDAPLALRRGIGALSRSHARKHGCRVRCLAPYSGPRPYGPVRMVRRRRPRRLV